MDNDVVVREYCEECGEAILDGDKAYVDRDGRYFDSLDCLMSYHDICEVEF